MAKSNPQTVTEYIQKMDPALAEIVEAIRKIILGADPEVGEQIKWNSPSFYYTGEMKPFNPKEYKRDLAVLNLHRGHALLVFPTGATINDTSGLLEGDYKDGRRMVTFLDMEAVKSKEKALQEVVKTWVKLVDR